MPEGSIGTENLGQVIERKLMRWCKKFRQMNSTFKYVLPYT